MNLIPIHHTMVQCSEELLVTQEELNRQFRRERLAANRGPLKQSVVRARLELETALWFAQRWTMLIGFAANDASQR